MSSYLIRDTVGRAALDLASAHAGLSQSAWSSVLDARRHFVGAGNRRRLFAAFDAMFDAADPLTPLHSPEVNIDFAGTRGEGDQRVVLTRLVFKNWRVFRSAEFEFPAFDAEKPVVLIGGKNGYGKTSVLEGLLYGLFGPEATIDLDRALRPGGESSASRTGRYKRTLESAFHRRARDAGAGVMSVRSEWSTGDGELIVERRWYFDDAGGLTDDDEGLNLWVGPDKEVLAVPQGETPELFYQAEVARRLMPSSLAAFVLFDGEQVRRFAERDFADQVRVAVETVLGLTTWREAIADLRDYARDRSKGAVRSGNEDPAADTVLNELETAERRLLDNIDKVQAAAAPMRARRDDVLAQLGALGDRTYATMQRLHERRQALTAQLSRTRHDLALAASTEPWRLVGLPLRRTLEANLTADRSADDAEGSWTDISLLDRLVSAAAIELTGIIETTTLEAGLRKAWEGLHCYEKAVEPTLHAYVSGPVRTAALSRLGARVNGSLNELAHLIDNAEAEVREIDAAIEERERQDQTSVVLRKELDSLTADLETMDGQRRVLDQALGRIQNDLTARRQLIESRLLARISDSQAIDRRRAALDLAQSADDLIEEIKPACFETVGTAVTEAYSALAHKGLVSRITIDPDGRVVLVDSRGVDVRATEASAGESQIFAMALMAAVAQLAGRKLPLIIDTPLGRLDPDHRKRVLAFFTSRDVQTLLLSQPDEVNRQYLDLIQHRVAAQFHLHHTLDGGGPGGSEPVEGYFPEIAA